MGLMRYIDFNQNIFSLPYSRQIKEFRGGADRSVTHLDWLLGLLERIWDQGWGRNFILFSCSILHDAQCGRVAVGEPIAGDRDSPWGDALLKTGRADGGLKAMGECGGCCMALAPWRQTTMLSHGTATLRLCPPRAACYTAVSPYPP